MKPLWENCRSDSNDQWYEDRDRSCAKKGDTSGYAQVNKPTGRNRTARIYEQVKIILGCGIPKGTPGVLPLSNLLEISPFRYFTISLSF
jgi:hypothetical protein